MALYTVLSPKFQDTIAIESFQEGRENDPEWDQVLADKVLGYVKQNIEEAREYRRRAPSGDLHIVNSHALSNASAVPSPISNQPSPAHRIPSPLPSASVSHSSPPASRPSSRSSPRITARISQIEFATLISKRAVEREAKIQRKKARFPAYSLWAIRSSIRTAELAELTRYFPKEVAAHGDPHEGYWERAKDSTPSPEQPTRQSSIKSGDEQLTQADDKRDEILRKRLTWRKEVEGLTGKDKEVAIQIDEESLLRKGMFDRPKLGTAENVRVERLDRRRTMQHQSSAAKTAAAEAQYEEKRRPNTVQGIQSKLSADLWERIAAFESSTSRRASMEAATSEPACPSPLRRGSLPGEEDDSWEKQDSDSGKALPKSPPRPLPLPKDSSATLKKSKRRGGFNG